MFCLKIVTIVLVSYAVSVQSLSEELQEVMKMLHNTCIEQSGATEAMIAAANSKGPFPDNPELKCYIKCIMTETATMDDSGDIDIEATIAMMPEDIVNDVIIDTIRKCGNPKGADPCETAWLAQKCWQETSPQYYMMF